MKNQAQKKGISLIALIITIIVIVLLAAIVVNTAITTPQSANFAKFASDMGELQQAVTLAYFDIYSTEVLKPTPKTDAEIYQDIAKGNGTSIPTTNIPSALSGATIAWKVNDTAKLDSVEALPHYGELYLTNNGIIYLASGFPYQGTTYLTASIKLNGSLSNSSNTITNSLGENLKNYTIYGNSIQNGTPTPTSPVAIKSLGDNGTITVKRCGKNLFDINNTVWSGKKYYEYPLTFLEPGKNYTLSLEKNLCISGLSPFSSAEVVVMNIPGITTAWTSTTLPYMGHSGSQQSRKILYNFTVPEEGVSLYYYTTDSNSQPPTAEFVKERFTAYFGNMMLNEGSTATAYEPYQEQTYTINLGDHEPLRAIGDVADTLDYTTGKITRRIGKIMFTKDVSYDLYPYNGMKGALTSKLLPVAGTRLSGISNRSNKVGKYYYSNSIWLGTESRVVYWIGILDELGYTTIEQFNNWIKDNETIIYYILDLPNEEEGILTMPLISTVAGSNTITASDGAVSASKIDMTYYQN